VPHGNWQGTSLGWTALVWLGHILSEGDHRLNQVEQWVEKRLHTLGISIGQQVRGLEWSDDRLGLVLDELADDETWRKFETDLNRHTFRVYDMKLRRVRVDSTTVSGYWTVTEEGLFQFGHSKDHRPDLPQLKVMMSALDPLGMPVATQVVSGEREADPAERADPARNGNAAYLRGVDPRRGRAGLRQPAASRGIDRRAVQAVAQPATKAAKSPVGDAAAEPASVCPRKDPTCRPQDDCLGGLAPGADEHRDPIGGHAARSVY